MPKSANQKLKLLYLVKILQEESDEAHPLTVSQLISALAQRGIAAERKSIYDDMEQLAHFGYDIVTVRGRGNAYYLGERTFQLPEVKLLVDAVQSAKFISAGKSRELIRKICSLTSRHQGVLMQRQVHVAARAKTQSERAYYNVDAIHSAIAAGRQIQFLYYEWVVDEKAPRLLARRARHGGEAYQVSPWTLLWDDEYYYLVAWDDAAAMMKHYRVDKMADIAQCEAPRAGQAAYEALDMAQYTQMVFGMFGGAQTHVKLRFANSLVGVVADRFGPDILIQKSGQAHFTVMVKVVPSPQFLSWVFGFGTDVQVLQPQELVEEIRREVAGLAALYDGTK